MSNENNVWKVMKRNIKCNISIYIIMKCEICQYIWMSWWEEREMKE